MYEELIQRLENAAGGPEGIKMAHDAADAIAALQSENAENAEKDEEIKRLKDEPLAYKFYYCESEDSYLLGRRLDTLYYARWHKSGFVWEMSRFLPWGQTIEAQDTAWKKHTYPSEPVEISPDEWFAGFLRKRFSRVEAERDKLLDRVHEAQVERDCARTERDAAKKCIYDIEAYLAFGSARYIGRTIQAWKSGAQGVE